MDVTIGAIRGMGASLLPMTVPALGICVFRGFRSFCVFHQPQYHTPECLCLSCPSPWIITFIAQITIFIILNQKNIEREKRCGRCKTGTSGALGHPPPGKIRTKKRKTFDQGLLFSFLVI